MSKIEGIVDRLKNKAGDIWQDLKTVRNDVMYLVGSLTILGADIVLFLWDLERLKVAFEDAMKDVRKTGLVSLISRQPVTK